MEQTNLDSTALGITNPYEYLPPLQTLYRSHNSTKKAKSLSTKESKETQGKTKSTKA